MTNDRAFALALGFAALGCVAEPQPAEEAPAAQEPAPANDAELPEPAIADRDHHDPGDVPVHLEFIDLAADGVLRLDEADSLTVRIVNDSDLSGVAVVEQDTVDLAEVRIGAGATRALEIPLSTIDLDASRSRHAASAHHLSFRIRLMTADKGLRSAPVRLAVLPTQTGFDFYGADAHDALVADLDLSAELRATLEEGPTAIELPDGTQLVAAPRVLGN